MKYAIIKNIPVNILLTRTSKDKIDWVKYGFSIDGLRLAKQGRNADGDYLNIFPITNEKIFESHLGSLVEFCEKTIVDNDSIEMVEEEDAQILKDSIIPPQEAEAV